jgi:transcriptional regulator with XRE-family HTH domain
MPTEAKSLGEKLRELRETYDLSQNQIAHALNIDRSTYTNYELDKTRPGLETLVKLAYIFSVPSESLLPDCEDYSPAVRDFIQPDSMIQTLTKDERGLLVMYRALTADQRRGIREEMAKIAKKNHPDHR